MFQVTDALQKAGITRISFQTIPAASEPSPAIAKQPTGASSPGKAARLQLKAQAEADAWTLAVRVAEQGRLASKPAPQSAEATPDLWGEPIDPLARPDPLQQSQQLAEARLRLAWDRYAPFRSAASATDKDVALAELALAKADLNLATRRLEQAAQIGQPATAQNERAAVGEELARAEALLQVATALYRKIGTGENPGRQVNRPGPVEMGPDQELDLVEAIGCAQGTTHQANIRRIELTRQGKTDRFNLDELRRSANKHWLEPGDVIFVLESAF